ncbi:23S rRNA (adenine(2503)-C(2))-methyltransferase RlmN [Desulfurivibrio dismutans]|uniref:23S rRNA (adenine(2503)-C(2))-methyltransferase RlmN n=1 Tax=Desulfurivibrio dismutans TaxID=1398908 RepID=UPI0023DCA52C|nr:23S rRNA (adenine(2503)-C(2))-methyltransferase RlmN [Desulfurivibrio alkaliphilus]MDF1615014.1 23S rRNA (adenine(2503)-C(2))-methyltransferase RlmN [Desulfurivibrio alkaliphilus]
MEKIDLKNLTLPELTAWVESLDLKPFRANQIFAWIQRPDFTDFMAMTDIAKHVRGLLAEKAMLSRLEPSKVEHSRDGTVKFAFTLHDGQVIESVLIPEDERYTLCVSSQVGCAMGCRFCLTGTMGFKRNLTVAEIIGQVDAAWRWLLARPGAIPEKVSDHGAPHLAAIEPAHVLMYALPSRLPQPAAPRDRLPRRHRDQLPEKSRISNLVFMGMGEPLLNFDHLIRAIKILMEQRGHDFSGRRITVSTCGIVPKMREMGEQVPVNLAVSLHAADDAIRERLMPINKKYPLDQLLRACREYPLPPRRRIMIEYVLIKDLNDSAAQARLLVKKLHGIRCKINILPYNEGPESRKSQENPENPDFPYRRPDEETVENFRQILRKAGHTTLLRQSRGSDISAACGQLAAKASLAVVDDEMNNDIEK